MRYKRGTKPSENKRTPEYTSWIHMRSRCLCPTNKAYKMYGGRGVSICKRWEIFEKFIADMGARPTNKHSLDRINPFGNYEPRNCAWGTRAEQGEHKRNVLYFTINGETKILAQWCRHYKIRYERVRQRLKRGLNIEQALEISV